MPLPEPLFELVSAIEVEAFAVVDDASPAIRDLDKITVRKRTRTGKSVRAFNPLAREDRQVFEALSGGEHDVRGFTNRDIRRRLTELKAPIWSKR